MTTDQPRYEEIADHLRSLVAAGAPGDRLPSDAELTEEFDVSRMTARHAVDQLVQEHLVERRRGIGTFIAPRRVPRVLGSPLSFTENMRSRGLTASSRLLAWGAIDPTDDERLALGLDDGPAMVLERLRLADEIPMAIERVVMPPHLALELPDDVADGSLHHAFATLGRHVTTAIASVDARRATKRERDLLEIGPDGVILRERRTMLDEDEQPLERTSTLYAAERYVFEAVLHRHDPSDPA